MIANVGPRKENVPPWITGLVVSGVVLAYILTGGVRAAALANAVQTIVFMLVGLLAFYLISDSLGGVEAASQNVLENRPELLAREGEIGHQVHFPGWCHALQLTDDQRFKALLGLLLHSILPFLLFFLLFFTIGIVV